MTAVRYTLFKISRSVEGVSICDVLSFRLLPRDMGSALASLHPLCRLPCRGKEVPCKTIVYNSSGQEAYDTLEIPRIYLPMNFCYP